MHLEDPLSRLDPTSFVTSSSRVGVLFAVERETGRIVSVEPARVKTTSGAGVIVANNVDGAREETGRRPTNPRPTSTMLPAGVR